MQLMEWTGIGLAILLVAVAALGLMWIRERRALRALQALPPAQRAIPKRDKKKDKPNFSALAGAIPDAFVQIDADRRVTFASPAAQQLWRGAFTGGMLLIELTRSYELDAIGEETLRERYLTPREITLGGRLFRVFGAKDPKRNTATLVLRDVSELQRLGRARRDFVANLSHELRTPLSAIKLLIETAPNPQDETLRAISAQTDTLAQIAQEMYDLSQIESGRLPMRMVAVNLAELAQGVALRLMPQAERAGLTLRNEIPDTAQALADPEQLTRVLTNLTHNAIKFTQTGGVTLFMPDRAALNHLVPQDFVTLGVRDTGAGIPRHEHSRIFERFYKVNRARGSAGTGLGLAIVKHIIEAHAGEVWLESAEGKGATFYFTLPAV